MASEDSNDETSSWKSESAKALMRAEEQQLLEWLFERAEVIQRGTENYYVLARRGKKGLR